jgi:integral membrane protein
MRNALIRYRVMAYIVGTMLVILVCVGIPLQVWGHDDRVESVTGVAHGWLYMIMIITAIDLGRRARWAWWRVLLIALSGLVPFVTFVAEHYATKDVKAKLAWNAANPTEPEAVIADPQA